MRFHNILEDLLGSRVKISTLKVLARYPRKEFSGSELARILKVSVSRVLEILELFYRYRVVYRTKVGKTYQWSLNKQSFIVDKLTPILDIDEMAFTTLKNYIKQSFKGKAGKILKIVLFGSLILGEERPESDIDIFILVKDDRYKKLIQEIIDDLNEKIVTIFGNSLSPIIYSQKEMESKKGLEFIKHVETEGQKIYD